MHHNISGGKGTGSSLTKLLPAVFSCGIGLLMITSGCATVSGVLIGNIVDSSTADFENLDVKNIKVIDWHTSLELILGDSAFLKGEFEGFINSDSSNTPGRGILPYADEMIDVAFFTGPSRKYFFKSFYYKMSNNEVYPVIRLGTKGEDLVQDLHQCPYIVRADGDTVRSEQILRLYGNSDYKGQSIILRDPLNVVHVPVEKIRTVTIVREKNALKYGLIAGVLIDIAWFTYLHFWFKAHPLE
jgi:hypothetical protein